MSEIYPTGVVIPYAGTTLPATGWLFCDGSEVLKLDYSDLYSIIKDVYGTATSGYFKLPDLRGRVVAGRDTMDNNADDGIGAAAGLLTGVPTEGVDGANLGATGGHQSHRLLAAESGVGAHSHTTYANRETNTTTGGGGNRLTQLGSTGANNAGTTSSISADASTAHNNVQPTIILQYIIKT
jgi:microcystin-dependent protein